MAAGIVPSDLYPAIRRFLLESGLQRTLRALDKETLAGEEEAPAPKSKKAKALAELELTAACQLWLDSRTAAPAANEEELKPKKQKKREEAVEEPAEAEAEVEAPRKKKRAAEPQEAEEAAEAKAAKEAKEEPPKKKQGEQPRSEAGDAFEAASVAGSDSSKKKQKNKDQKAPTPFKRIDEEKWTKVIQDQRLLDNTHRAKQKFGTSQGDTWGDKAAEDLGKVKGKGFRKEMAKKKRSSWRGGGEIDQGVNSIKFDDSDEE